MYDKNDNKKEFAKDEPSDEEEELGEQHHEEAANQRQVYVDYQCSDVKEPEIRKHFEQFGQVEEVQLATSPLNPTIVVFKSAALATSLFGQTHILQHTVGRGGSVPLRLRGGSGRGLRIPPRQLRHNTCPFRYGFWF